MPNFISHRYHNSPEDQTQSDLPPTERSHNLTGTNTVKQHTCPHRRNNHH